MHAAEQTMLQWLDLYVKPVSVHVQALLNVSCEAQ